MATRSLSSIRSLDDCLGQIHRLVKLRSTLMDSQPPKDPSRIPLETSLAGPFQDAVDLFSNLKINYALIGGIAAMVYGRLRATEDVDFVASTLHEEILRANPDAMRAAHFDPAVTWKLYHDSGVEIDIWKDEHSNAIVERAQTVQFAGRHVQIAEVHDLIAMKLRADRTQDDYDVSEILKNVQINESLVRERVTHDQFAHFLDIKKRTHR